MLDSAVDHVHLSNVRPGPGLAAFIAALACVAAFSAPVHAAAGPTVAIVPPAEGEPRPGSPSLVTLGDALREKGVTVVALGDYFAAADAQGIEPDRRRSPAAIRSVSTALGLNGVVFVSRTLPPPLPPPGEDVAPARRGMQQQVYAANGELIWDGRIAMAGDDLSSAEAGALSSFALQSLVAAPEELRRRSVQGEVIDYAEEAISPSPRALALTRLGAEVNFNLRESNTQPPGGTPIGFDTSTPYIGAGVRFDSFPLPEAWGGRILGLGVEYSYASVRVSEATPSGSLSQPASDHRVIADLIGRFVLDSKNRFILRGGFAYQTFLIEQTSTLASIDHISGHLAVEYERVLPAGLELWLRGGVRPLSHVGRDYPTIFGEHSTSIGWEARVTLSGSLESLIPNFRWTAGYDHLGYSDRFSSPSVGITPHVERYHRLFVGVIWARG